MKEKKLAIQLLTENTETALNFKINQFIFLRKHQRRESLHPLTKGFRN